MKRFIKLSTHDYDVFTSKACFSSENIEALCSVSYEDFADCVCLSFKRWDDLSFVSSALFYEGILHRVNI